MYMFFLKKKVGFACFDRYCPRMLCSITTINLLKLWSFDFLMTEYEPDCVVIMTGFKNKKGKRMLRDL